MSNNHFQTMLITGLAIGFGATATLSLRPHSAIGFPAAPAVSLGSNPIQAWAGTINSNTSTILSAPSDQNIVLTDIHFSCNYTCETRVTMTRSDGTVVGSFWVSGGYGSDRDSLSIQQQFSSGIPIPAGQSLVLNTTGNTIAYTLSGYQAHP